MSKSPKIPASMAKKEGNVVAVYTAYNPSENLRLSVLESLKQCSRVIVADNSPTGSTNAAMVLGKIRNVKIIGQGTNIGLANALNDAFKLVGAAEFVFLLDQDSVPQPGLVNKLKSIMDEYPRVGAIGPAPWDETNNRFIDPRTSGRSDLATMPVIITSAMLMRTHAFFSTTGFRGDFFVDCVDQDMCLQLRKQGWEILQDKTALLPHSLGNTRWHGFGPLKIRATHHPTWRLYWAARNGVILSKEYWRFDTKWAMTNIAILCYWILTVTLFETPRFSKLKAMFRGISDGISNRSREQYLPAGAKR